MSETNPQRNEEPLWLFIENVQDYAVFMLRPDGCVATWNLGAERIKGYKSSEIIGQPGRNPRTQAYRMGWLGISRSRRHRCLSCLRSERLTFEYRLPAKICWDPMRSPSCSAKPSSGAVARIARCSPLCSIVLRIVAAAHDRPSPRFFEIVS